jgi:hypothetical protein
MSLSTQLESRATKIKNLFKFFLRINILSVMRRIPEFLMPSTRVSYMQELNATTSPTFFLEEGQNAP